ncbi:MAG: hypothetical protein CME68_06335 [Halobacteriovoraceae bacterium]|nr:hypothetical protein [Halobacteriovoraceae bacterium]
MHINKESRYIDLDYKPIYAKGSKDKVDKVICIATDITQKVALEKQLELDKQNVYFIKSCLQSPVEFVDLMDDTNDLLEVYPKIKNDNHAELFRKFHTLKARYGQFWIKELSNAINEIETEISKGNLDKLDFKINDFERELHEFVKKNRLIIEAANKFMIDEGKAIQVSDILDNQEKFSDLETFFKYLKENFIHSDIKEKFKRYVSLVDDIANKQNKIINMKIEGDEVRVNTSRYNHFINASIHLFRNMIDHGIETEYARIEKAKSRKGNIKLEFKNISNYFLIEITDDGAGIDPKKIKVKAIEKGFKSEYELGKLNASEVIDLIFLPGLSVKDEVTEVSGRGVGMSAVRTEIERLGGTISVSSEIDVGTKFTIKLPLLK